MLNACKAFLVVSSQGGRETRADYSFTLKWGFFFFFFLSIGLWANLFRAIFGMARNPGSVTRFFDLNLFSCRFLCFCGLVFRPFGG